MATILIIEDDGLLMSTLSNMLRHEGFRVKKADTLSTAIEFLKSSDEINLILLDIWLDGYASFPIIDSAKKLRSSVPIVVMSGGGGPLSLEVASSIAEMKGISGFVQKPVERALLTETINQFL